MIRVFIAAGYAVRYLTAIAALLSHSFVVQAIGFAMLACMIAYDLRLTGKS